MVKGDFFRVFLEDVMIRLNLYLFFLMVMFITLRYSARVLWLLDSSPLFQRLYGWVLMYHFIMPRAMGIYWHGAP